MRKLSWLLTAVALAFYTTYLWSTADPTATYVMRDGLLLAGVAVGIFARHAGRSELGLAWSGLHRLRGQLTATGSILLGTGAVCALVGGILPVLMAAPIAISTGLILRWLGLWLLALVVGWPRAWQSVHQTPINQEGSPSNAIQTDRSLPAMSGMPWLALFLVLLIGLGVRLLILSRLPSFCVGAECEVALALNGTLATTTSTAWLPQLLFRLTEQNLPSVRLSGMLLALLIIPLFYLFLRRLTNNGAALVGALLLTFAPWFNTLDGGAFSTITLLLWSCVGLWLLWEGIDRQQPRWALPAGAALGLAGGGIVVQTGLLFWLLLLVLVMLGFPHGRRDLSSALLALLGFLVVATPIFLLPENGISALTNAAAGALDGATWLFTLFQQGLLTDTRWQGVPPLALPLGPLALLGLGVYLRRLKEPIYLWLASGVLIFGLILFYTGGGESLALFFLLALITAALAFATLLDAFYASWQPLVPFAHTVAMAGLVVLFLSTGPLMTMLNKGQSSRSLDEIALEQAMTEALATLLDQSPDRTIFAPASLLTNSGTRLRLGDAALTNIQPLADLVNTLYTTDEPRETIYLIPADAQPYVDLLQRVQPGAVVDRHIDPATGELRFSMITALQADQLARQGLLGVAWENNATGNSNPRMLPATGSLALPGIEVMLQPPYTLQWSGALRVATPGTYRIALDQAAGDGGQTAPAEAQPLITLQLDNRLILDSSLGLLAQEVRLVKGFYQVALLYRSPAAAEQSSSGTTSPMPFTIRWQRPDGVDEIIPRTVLYNLPLPNFGLIGEYYRGESPQGEPFDVRKDLVVGLAAERGEPYTVRWRGQLAAPRAGEYLIAALSAPGSRTQLSLNGIQLFDTTATAAGSDDTQSPTRPQQTSAYAEGTIYLTRGWHEVAVDFVPDPAAPTMQLFWQPPGSNPMALDVTYLAPILTPLLETDRALPIGPSLVNGGVDTAFALSYGTEFWQPQVQVPPGSLPDLSFELQWQIGSCGAADNQLDQPHGVALSGVRGLLHVADSANRRVIEYTLAGAVNRIYTSPDWQEPFAVALLDDGFPVLLDATTQLLYDLNTVTGAVEQRPLRASFYHPRGLAVDSAANLLVADTGGGRVVQLTPAGEELRMVGGQGTQIGRGQPTAVAGIGGVLWAVTAEDGRLWQLESGGSLVAIEHTNTLNGPQLAALPNGSLFLSDPARRRVLYLAATGEPLAHFAVPNFLVPTGIAVTAIDDLLYLAVVDSGNCQLSLWRTPLAMLPLRQ